MAQKDDAEGSAVLAAPFWRGCQSRRSERARRAAKERPSRSPFHLSTGGIGPADWEAAERAAAVSNPRWPSHCLVLRSGHEKDKSLTLYQKLIEARTETGEKASTPNLQDFERFVRQKTKDLKDKGGNEIEYSVSVENGRVKLKARVSS